MTRFETFITESEGTVREKLDHALNALMDRDGTLLRKPAATERSISFRLAMHLQEAFPDWDVDCEYNLWETPCRCVKHMSTTAHSAATEACTAYPDITIHRRDTAEKLLVIELKKSTSLLGKHQDIKKIRAYKIEHGYQHAIFLIVGVGGEVGINTLDNILEP